MTFQILQKKNPDVEFIFKTKKLFLEDVDLNKKSQESMVYNAKLRNCKLTFGEDSRQLIAKSKCVIGFNSTPLIAALILKKPILVQTNIKQKLQQVQKFKN